MPKKKTLLISVIQHTLGKSLHLLYQKHFKFWLKTLKNFPLGPVCSVSAEEVKKVGGSSVERHAGEGQWVPVRAIPLINRCSACRALLGVRHDARRA